MVNHITQVMTHYRQKFPGTIISWNVVNEPTGQNPANPIGSRGSIWSAIGSAPQDYIALAFRTARAADPNAVLCVNDYPEDSGELRFSADYDLIVSLKTQKVPIDCLGVQMHMGVFPSGNKLPSYASLMQEFAQFAAIGVQIQITEADYEVAAGQTGGYGTAVPEWQQVLQACVDSANCAAFNLWPYSNRYSDIPSQDGGTPYNAADINLQRTPVFSALANVLNH